MKKRFVSIWFPHLVADWHIRKQPFLRDRAFVIKASSHNRMIVTAASPLAQAQDIRKGMVLADARALYPSLHTIDDKPGLASQLLDRIAEWCIRFTPCSAADYPEGVLLDATGCAHLWGGEEAYLTDISNRFKRRGYTVCLAMADTIGGAWALARYGSEKRISRTGEPELVLLPLPVSALRLEEETVIRLHKLGLRQIRDLLTIPRTSLRRRFGAGLIQRLEQAMGNAEELIVPVYPPEAYQERLPCLEPVLTLAGIETALQRLLLALCSRLRKEGKGLRAAVFRAYRIDGGTSGIEIGTNRPSCKEEHLFYLFSLKFSSMEPSSGIELFILEATRVEEYRPVQEQLWQTQHSLDDAQVAELVDRLAGKLGPESLHRYLPAEHYWPERSFKRAASLTERPATKWKLDRPRPMQVLQPPERIEVTAPIPDYPPMLFRYNGQLHRIVKADGPERIEQEWWISEGEHRDYYCVEDEEGKRYWLFRQGHYNEEKAPLWFLHGFFA